ncbi:hypothetical protein BJX61DRAFT_540518 [Aspergillus egyptiacus]|nr:hypothetical protein BJX61DRAFT_540518 [Aspergillus egyptiacus]
MIIRRPGSGCTTFLVAALIFILLFLGTQDALHLTPELLHSTTTTSSSKIPNQIHYVYILRDPAANFTFQFKHFLSLYSTLHHWHPEKIYLHTNAHNTSIEHARTGQSGKWNRLIFTTPNLHINPVDPPTAAHNGHPIDQIEHKSDFIRVSAVRQFGGVYLDWDAHPIRDIAPVRESGFTSITGRQAGGEIMSGTFLARKDALLLRMWEEEMHRVYDGGWTTHSNAAVTRLGQRLARLPGEVLIMEQDAFGPGSWMVQDNIELYGIHNETDAELDVDSISDCTLLPVFPDEGLTDRWDPERAGEFPAWERDYSNTYILHAFSPARNGNPVEGFEAITPRYVLERRSNFARVLYPVVRRMCEEGVLGMDDSYIG